ncbi:MAG: hypothetical protein ACYDFT_00290 [Thermoplasmata archaeon]
MARSWFATGIGVFGVVLIVLGVLILLAFGGVYNPPDATIIFLVVGALLVLMGLVEDVWAEKRRH